jgi:hypothetical protein
MGYRIYSISSGEFLTGMDLIRMLPKPSKFLLLKVSKTQIHTRHISFSPLLFKHKKDAFWVLRHIVKPFCKTNNYLPCAFSDFDVI